MDNQLSRGIAVRETLMELVFVIVPLLVLTFVLRLNNHAWFQVFSSEEWSFAAVILMGQAITKYVFRSVGRPGVQRDWAGLVVAMLTVLGLIPAVVILMAVLDSNPNKPSATLVYIQLLWFFVAVLCLIWFGALAGLKYRQEHGSGTGESEHQMLIR